VTPALDKAVLRPRMRGLRRRLAEAAPQAARQAAAHAPLERLCAFEVVGAYHPHGSEMDPGPLAKRLAEAGAALALPLAARRDAAFEFRLWTPGDPLAPDAFGVLSPTEAAPAVRPQLVIAPVLAFDRRGGRLGQGGGHYDRTLQNLRDAGPVFILGLAFAGQEVEAIPMEPHDQRLDAILTEAGYIAALEET